MWNSKSLMASCHHTCWSPAGPYFAAAWTEQGRGKITEANPSEEGGTEILPEIWMKF